MRIRVTHLRFSVLRMCGWIPPMITTVVILQAIRRTVMFVANLANIGCQMNGVHIFYVLTQTRRFQHFWAMRALRSNVRIAFCNRRRRYLITTNQLLGTKNQNMLNQSLLLIKESYFNRKRGKPFFIFFF